MHSYPDGQVFYRKLTKAYPRILRGPVGCTAGLAFVDDAGTSAPFPRALRFAETFADAALEAGLVVWPNVGHADGSRGDLVMLAPPFSVSEAELDEIVTRFATALDRTLITLAAGVA